MKRNGLPEAVQAKFPGKLLAYNCSPSFNWKEKLDQRDDRKVSARARRDGLQVSVRYSGGFPRAQLQHVQLAHGYSDRGMAAYSELQEAEFAAEADGYTATKHQRRSAPATSMKWHR